jgi:hypothetical protein
MSFWGLFPWTGVTLSLMETTTQGSSAFDAGRISRTARYSTSQRCQAALSHHEREDHIIDVPTGYSFWRSYHPDFWPGPLLGFAAPDPRSLEPVARTFVPNPTEDPLDVSADQSADAGDKEL